MKLIPKNQYLQDDDLNMHDVISMSDIVVSSNVSSTILTSLCMGVPNVSLDVLSNGYNFKRYSEYICAESGEELVSNIEYILANGLPEEVFKNIKKDNSDIYGSVMESSTRIKEELNKIISDSS